ncbi:MAG: heme exporter protein CcmB [Cyclobacteriaceae bacterium]
MKEIFAIVKKEYLVDSRQKYLIAGIALYIFATIYISYLTFNNIINSTTWNALFWIILLFASLTGIGKSFIQEENRSYYYYFLIKPTNILLGKLIYYTVYEFVLLALTFGLVTVFLGNPLNQLGLFLINLALGAMGIAASFTMTSAIASKSTNQSTMLAVISFPIIIPVLILAVKNSKQIVLGANWADISGNTFALISVIVVIIAVSFILFPYSWKN